MAKTMSIEVIGIPELKKLMSKKSKDATLGMTKGVARASIYVQGEVKKSIAGRAAEHASVDTGRFLNSVGIDFKKEEATVFSSLPYARKLEFGTNFKNSPRSHFANSAARSKDKVIEILNKEIVDILKGFAKPIKRLF